MKKTVFAIWLAFFMAGSVVAQDQIPSGMGSGERVLEGVIIRAISAGDLVIWEKGKLYPFTLYGIQLPNPDSDQGRQAKIKVSELVFNKTLSVRLVESDPAMGIVIIQGKCLNELLVRQGAARVGKACKKEPQCSQWRAAEKVAETAGTGIWNVLD